QGRAGRRGQPSIVATFCSSLGRTARHDQYFFRFPDRVIAGSVAPPRFRLENRALLEAHLNALVLQLTDWKLPTEAQDVLDLAAGVRQTMPMKPALTQELTRKVAAARSQVVHAATAAFRQEVTAVGYSDDELSRLVESFPERLDRQLDAFRDEYRDLLEEG